eukprot:scaffold456849_cov18-Prasinocladus_malaysianus.AAC.2
MGHGQEDFGVANCELQDLIRGDVAAVHNIVVVVNVQLLAAKHLGVLYRSATLRHFEGRVGVLLLGAAVWEVDIGADLAAEGELSLRDRERERHPLEVEGPGDHTVCDLGGREILLAG